MKKHFIFAALLLSGAYKGIAQCDPNGISTDPANPVTNPGGRLNTFDYTATGWPLRTEYSSETTRWVPSPFSSHNSQNNPAIDHFYDPFDHVRDVLPVDGWELIKRDFGYEDNGQPSVALAKNPFIVLYNRHTGLLRVFAMRYNQQSYNGASIRVRFTDRSPMQTSLLDMSAGVKAVDAAFIRGQKLESLVDFPAAPFEWFYSDFQMAYDPCTCLFESKLAVSVDLSNNSSISLNGYSITEQGQPNSEQAARGPLSFGDLQTGAKKGIQKFKDGETMAANIKDAIAKAGDSNGTKALGLTNLVAKLKDNTFLKAGLASVPYATAALGVLKFFIGGGKQSGGALTPSPVIVRNDYSFSGEIKQEYSGFVNMAFRTPGSITSNVAAAELPYYNEVMGVFNLLKTPKIVSSVQYPQIIVPGDGGGGGGSGGGGSYPYTTTFSLADDVEYVLNPASNLILEEAEFFLSIRDEYGKTKMIPLSSSGTGSYTVTEGVLPKLGDEFMVVLNLKRKNATATTQNILISLKYPVQAVAAKIKEGASILKANDFIINNFCNSAAYKQTGRFPAKTSYAQAVARLAQEERESEEKANNAQTENQIFKTYPNPTQGIFTLSLPAGIEGSGQVEVFNMLGEKVLSLNMDALSQNLEIDITGRPAGLYMVRVSRNNQMYSSKIVLE